ncbi:hypothetical protein FO519_004525 [Halicephalobus sp. NKZ332]|nr:hypothetical protein FO519_004525 [Halicephalobus sp. NKZ332]
MSNITFSKILELNDIYNKKFADIYVSIMSIIGFSGVTLSVFLLFLISSQSPPSMKKFKIYLFCYTVVNITVELSALLYMPIGIPYFMIIYPRGFLSPMSIMTSKILFYGLLVSGYILMMLLLLRVLDRYSIMIDLELITTPYFLASPNFYIYCCYFSFISGPITLFFIIFMMDLFYEPTAPIMIASVFNSSLGPLYYVSIACIWSFPVIDSIVIIFSIKPYKKFIMTKMNPFKCIPNSRVGIDTQNSTQPERSKYIESQTSSNQQIP